MNCCVAPILFHNVSLNFVVDLSKLKDPNDVRVDDLETTGSCLIQFTVRMTNSLVNDTSSNAEVVHACRQYHVHATDPDLHRIAAIVLVYPPPN